MHRTRGDRLMWHAAALLPILALLAGCAQKVPVEQAEASCVNDAFMAKRPRTDLDLGLGIDTDGDISGFGGISMRISSDYLAARDPAEVYSQCVYRRSGKPPRKPLYEQPDWRG